MMPTASDVSSHDCPKCQHGKLIQLRSALTVYKCEKCAAIFSARDVELMQHPETTQSVPGLQSVAGLKFQAEFMGTVAFCFHLCAGACVIVVLGRTFWYGYLRSLTFLKSGERVADTSVVSHK
jgi:hypothetical protein